MMIQYSDRALCDVVLGAELFETITRVLQHVRRCRKDETHVVVDAERCAGDAE
jgi:hypothetical protein